MSKISFISFCIEYYAEHIGKSSNEVYKLFKESCLIDLLNEDYDDLHGMSFEYLMQFIDEYLEIFNNIMYENDIVTHSTVRATNLPIIVKLIAEKFNCSELEALDRFYKSAVGECFADDDTGLFGQSALHVYGLFLEEMNYAENK